MSLRIAVRTMADLESNLVSIERVHEYMILPSEVCFSHLRSKFTNYLRVMSPFHFRLHGTMKAPGRPKIGLRMEQFVLKTIR